MKHMIQSLIFTCFFDSHYIAGTFHHTDHAVVTSRIRTDLADFTVGQILADRTWLNLLVCFQNGVGKFLCLVVREI